MASPTSKQEKKLVEFLKEQQEPFILELYLLEKSKSWNSIKNFETPPSNSVINKKHKPFFPFFKVLLTALHHKKKKKKKLFATIKDSNTTIKHANVVDITQEAKNNFAQTTMDQTERFSTASSSTMFYSCSDIDDDDDDDHDHEEEEEDIASCVGNQSQQDTINRKHRQRCIEVCVTHETLNKDVCVCGMVVPKKMTEDSLLSAALFSSIFQTSKKNYTKQLQEILGHKTKRLLFDCVRELTIKLNRKDCKGSSTEKLGKIIWERTKKWSQRGGNFERNLLNLDYLDSINEWSEYKTEVKDVSFEIADAILECVMKDEIVSEMFETLTPTTQ
ncbi:unnamed protein product [Trifolium pratense]|uniref:Uncharacterized protein n=1 Tax=Trifolium pratense TaxID=57577 RepID=A0ACB0JJR8_TRIPR|nr:unnamed protein product [Trifolium pratense]